MFHAYLRVHLRSRSSGLYVDLVFVVLKYHNIVVAKKANLGQKMREPYMPHHLRLDSSDVTQA